MPRDDQGLGCGERRSERAPLPSPRQAFEIAHDAFLTLDGEGHIVYANPAAERLLGYEPGQAEGVTFPTVVVEEERELVSEALRSLTVGGRERGVSWRLF